MLNLNDRLTISIVIDPIEICGQKDNPILSQPNSLK